MVSIHLLYSFQELNRLTVELSLLFLACLPSLRPVLSLIAEKLVLLRKRKSTYKRGSKLLMDMLPAGRSAPLPILPLSREQSGTDERHLILDSSAIIEVEANNPRPPELDAEAPGPHILEIETVEPILEMAYQRTIPELEGQSRSDVAEL